MTISSVDINLVISVSWPGMGSSCKYCFLCLLKEIKCFHLFNLIERERERESSSIKIEIILLIHLTICLKIFKNFCKNILN